ncbi:MAG: LysR family transcriptional regulator [Burkholderiales bacterium]|nr:LysR family transcriptional regulator [Burkholderiales bacterium]
MLELRQLRYFVAVAQVGHVGRAAEHLAMSQPPLSRQIRELEAQLGLTLFDRDRRRLKLTRAGQDLLVQAQALLAHAAELEQAALRAGRGAEGRLTLGCVEGALQAGLVQSDIAALAAAAPQVVVELRAQRTQAIVDGLRRGELDLGYCYSAPPQDDAHLASTLRLEEDFVLALPKAHALARARALRPQQLEGLPFIAMPAATHATARAEFLAGCQAGGFTPELRYEAAELSSILSLVGAGLGLAIVGRGCQRQAPPGVAFRPLPWLPMRLRIHLVWRRMPLAAAATRFVDLARAAT